MGGEVQLYRSKWEEEIEYILEENFSRLPASCESLGVIELYPKPAAEV
jgi:hypothetical protein